MTSLRKNQFGIRALFVAMVVTSFSLAIAQYLVSISDEVFVFSLTVAIISALFCAAMIAVSLFFAACVALTDHYPPLRKSNFQQCTHMLVFGCVAVVPLVLLLVVSIT